MEELSKTRKDAPYGWVLVVGAVVRWIGKGMRGNSGFRDERAAALEVGLEQALQPTLIGFKHCGPEGTHGDMPIR